MKKVAVILALMLTSTFTFAQDAPAQEESTEQESKFAAAVDVVYPYLWRGISLISTEKVAFQPYASYSFTDKLTLGVWATTNFSGDEKSYNEFDWYVSYQATPVLKVMLSDYYFNGTLENGLTRSSYWNYDENSAQVMDFSLLFSFADKGVPLDFQWNTIIYGNDFSYDDNGDKSRAFSSYAEVGYTYSLKNAEVDFRPFVGAAVINDNGFYGIDENGDSGFGFSNVGLNVAKAFKITEKYSLPVFLRYTYNDFGNVNSDGENKHNFISGGVTFTIQ